METIVYEDRIMGLAQQDNANQFMQQKIFCWVIIFDILYSRIILKSLIKFEL